MRAILRSGDRLTPTAVSQSRGDELFKALADPTRREILSLLRGRRLSVGDLASNFRMSRPAVSKHLRLLRDAKLVRDLPVGTTVYCELNAEPLRGVDAWLEDFKTFWDRSLIRLKEHVERNA